MKPRSAESALLCALRFSVLPFAMTTSTYSPFVRKVARRAGFSAASIRAAEKRLVERGFIRAPKTADRKYHGLALTERGLRVSARACGIVDLPPWVKGGTAVGTGRRI